ncbi:hypothetical protein Tco_0887455 [Tanacetum coccineum]
MFRYRMFAKIGALTSCNKRPGNSYDIKLVTLRNSFAALNEQEKVFKIVENSKLINVRKVVPKVTINSTFASCVDRKQGEKVIEDSESDVEDVYDKTLYGL